MNAFMLMIECCDIYQAIIRFNISCDLALPIRVTASEQKKTN